MLSDSTIRELCRTKNLITPFDEHDLQPCSYDLTLGDTIIIPEGNRLVNKDNNRFNNDETDLNMIGIYIRPKEFLLATTKERVNIPDDIVGQIEGKSSVGRLGLFIQNAGLVDPGFSGTVTLELFNAGDNYICINDIRKICQITFSRLDRPCKTPYQGRYQNQDGVTASRLFRKE